MQHGKKSLCKVMSHSKDIVSDKKLLCISEMTFEGQAWGPSYLRPAKIISYLIQPVQQDGSHPRLEVGVVVKHVGILHHSGPGVHLTHALPHITGIRPGQPRQGTFALRWSGIYLACAASEVNNNTLLIFTDCV